MTALEQSANMKFWNSLIKPVTIAADVYEYISSKKFVAKVLQQIESSRKYLEFHLK